MEGILFMSKIGPMYMNKTTHNKANTNFKLPNKINTK